MNTRNTLKEYYINIQKLYQDAVAMLTAMNQSLVTTASEVTVTLTSSDNATSTVRLPSFLYLENKVEQLSNNIDNLFKMPSSGEAWFSNTGGMYKLNMVKSNTAPLTPLFSTNGIFASSTDNNILRDLVSPKTYLKINITNLQDNMDKMFMRKYIIYDSLVFNNDLIQSAKTYDEFVAAIYSLQKGIDYDVYDSTLDLPIKNDVYNSAFNIVNIPAQDLNDNTIENPVIDTTNGNVSHYTYTLELDTLTYTSAEDSSIVYTLKVGDFLCLGNEYVIYKVKEVYTSNNRIVIEEQLGHIALQDYSSNTSMTLQIYNEDYSNYHYVNIPLEENPYICVFLGTMQGNTRSVLSAPICINLNEIMMYDNYGNPILDTYGAHMNYISYYEKYCKNIGDLILGLTEAAYPQLSNFTISELNTLQSADAIKNMVSETINENVLKVVPINKHLIDDVTSEAIINLHAQKASVNSDLTTLNDNISNIYNQLLTTDFSQEVTVTQNSLKTKLDNYYSEKTSLQTQLNNIINEICTRGSDITLSISETKYRIRGISSVATLEEYLHTQYGDNCDIIGIDIEYKYKSNNTDTTTLTEINSSTFTDWNKQENIDKQRELKFNTATTSFNIEYKEYLTTDNIIKWNQFDIPINQGEDVVIRIRYKYSIGQPFISLYTPWSEEFTMVFPAEYTENTELLSIINANNDDSINAAFTNTLMNDGYQAHNNNKIIDGSQTFYHMPENIYSGFNTAENSLISLKDKLQAMVNDIDKYKTLIEGELNTKYSVYLQYNDNTLELTRNSSNHFNIYNINHITDTFVREDMSIIIKNTGSSTVKLYSLFPGNTDTPLLSCADNFYNKYIERYERIPLIENDKWAMQTLGQWIYFRTNNTWTNTKYYLDTTEQRIADKITPNSNKNVTKLNFLPFISDYINKDNKQVLYGYRYRYNTDSLSTWTKIDNPVIWNKCNVYFNESGQFVISDTNDINETTSESMDIDDYVEVLNDIYGSKSIDMFKYWKYINNEYTNGYSNGFLIRYEDVCGKSAKGDSSDVVFLDSSTPINKFLNTYNVKLGEGIELDANNLQGAFFYPNIDVHKSIITDGNETGCITLGVGQSLSIPVTFEYFMPNASINKTITKTLSFDLRPSLYRNEDNYIISITANVDNTATGDMYVTNTALTDYSTD